MKAASSRMICGFLHSLCVLFLSCPPIYAQSPVAPPAKYNPSELEAKVQLLTELLERTREELKESRSEIQQFRRMVEQALQKMGDFASSDSGAASKSKELPVGLLGSSQPTGPDANLQVRAISEDDWEILNARVDEHEQVKVESSTKYRLKISGIALLTAFDTFGNTDNLDLPAIALHRQKGQAGSSIGGSLRQSLLGLRGLGPTLLGANTSADFQVDFLGGAAGAYGGAAAGVMSLRMARIQFDWKSTSVTAGLDRPFFSPNSPTSYMSVAVPAFSSAGNLWAWTPVIRAEQRFKTDASQFKIEAGVLDPVGYSVMPENRRVPTPGESSRQPTYSLRLSENSRDEDRPSSFGISSLYSPLRFPDGARVSGWGGAADWRLRLPMHTEWGGAFFAGRGLDGFGGVAVPSVKPQDYAHYLYVSAPALARILTLGGWSQFKVSVGARSEFNLAAGLGARNSSRLRQSSLSDPFLLSVPNSNQMLFFNYIFHPRSDLVFSTEYRRFRTLQISGAPATADQLGLAAGFLF